jgi:alpha-L-arabinofuranosidase
MVEWAEEARLTFLRFPGGNWGDEYRMLDRHVDEFVAFARSLGAEPMIHVRLFRAEAEQAAARVAYANQTMGYGVRYWAIGNEPSLYHPNRGLAGYDTRAFNAQWREFALAMKEADPSILLLGPDTHQYTGRPGEDPRDAAGLDWMEEFLRANGDLVDVVSFHRYPFGTTDPQPGDLLRSSAEWDAIIPSLRRLIGETTGRDLPIAVTEVNSNWSNRSGGQATPDSLANAIWWADVLGRLISERVGIVAHFALEGAGGLGMLTTQGPRPTYYVYTLYREFGDELVYSSSGDPALRVYAARRADGALTVLVVNLGAQETESPLRLASFTAEPLAETWLLDRGHLAENVGTTEVQEEGRVVFPGESVTLLVLMPR